MRLAEAIGRLEPVPGIRTHDQIEGVYVWIWPPALEIADLDAPIRISSEVAARDASHGWVRIDPNAAQLALSQQHGGFARATPRIQGPGVASHESHNVVYQSGRMGWAGQVVKLGHLSENETLLTRHRLRRSSDLTHL